MTDWHIRRVADDDLEGLERIRELFTEYYAWLGDIVCSSRLAAEIAELPGPYASPGGSLFIAQDDGGLSGGCVGVMPHHWDGACEIKRLYVRPSARGASLGRHLLDTALDAARGLGYRTALISTIPAMMPTARAMYMRTGFVASENFENHVHDERAEMEFLRLEL